GEDPRRGSKTYGEPTEAAHHGRIPGCVFSGLCHLLATRIDSSQAHRAPQRSCTAAHCAKPRHERGTADRVAQPVLAWMDHLLPDRQLQARSAADDGVDQAKAAHEADA